MNLSKFEVTSKCQEISNTEEHIRDQSALAETGLFKVNGTKPKLFPTHYGTAVLPNIMPYRSYQDRYLANQAYFLPQWDHDTGPETNRPRILSVSSTSLLNREHNSALTKTKICEHWRRTGICSYGDLCWYAHGEDDLRKINSTKIGRNEEKTSKENEQPGSRRPTVPVSEDLLENTAIKTMKDEPKEVPPTKRTSTNVKGLTVTIPPNIAFKEQVPNSSLPLSPAQERWISMSIGGNGAPVPANEKSSDHTSVLSSSTMMNDAESDFEKKQTLENAIDRKQSVRQFARNEEAFKQDEFGFLSPNGIPFNSRLPSHNGHMHSHHRSFSRGPHQRTTHNTAAFGGMPHQQQHPTPCQNQARASRSGTSGFGSSFDDSRSFMHSQRSSSLIRSARDHPQMPHNGSHPQIQQACWNLAGDLYQRQKDIETSGMRVVDQHQQSQMSSRKFEEFELSRLLAQQQQKKQEMMMGHEASKLKDLAFLRYQLERGAIRKHQVPRELWNELISNLPLLNQHLQQQIINNGIKSHGSGSDCSCGGSRLKQPSEQVHFAQTRQQSHQQPQHHHNIPHQQQQHQFRRYGMPATVPCELAAPPKIFESLLPSDDSFSIWLDPKPRKETSGFLRPPARNIEHSNSGASLLAKMDQLRSERFPISEEEITLANGSLRSAPPERATKNEESSPVAMSLMELLSSENLLDQTSRRMKPKTTMFDFDTFKIAETLGMTPQSSVSSRQTPASLKSESPMFFIGEEKTPGYDDVCSGLFTPLSANNPFLERCDFFAASGSCPFGDKCHLSHSIPDKQKTELKAL